MVLGLVFGVGVGVWCWVWWLVFSVWVRVLHPSQFENNYFTEMCSGSDTGSYLRFIDFVYHSTLGLRVIKKRRRLVCRVYGLGVGVQG